VDWSQTKAYALGLGGIYLNVRGREERGIVSPQDGERIKTDLIKGLTGLVDAELGKLAVTSVLAREQIYKGPYTVEAPDLLVNFSEGYRVSWDTPLGGVPEKLFEDNVKKWGGDHVIDPASYRGTADEPAISWGCSQPGRYCADNPGCIRCTQGSGDGREFPLMKILIIGLDIAPAVDLFGDERLENLRRLMAYGCYGRLSGVAHRAVKAWIAY
jgi:predicted AlkP superfamily phosphohydrolase/phosphomutase